MTLRARRQLLFSFSASLAVALVVAWLLWPRTAITRENAAMIRPGMTRGEVEAILGGPPRDETTGPPRTAMIQSVRPDREWNSNQLSI
jgi:hypothetical protein